MPENRGSATAATTARGHRPLPRADRSAYRAAHQPQEKKPATFDWDWNKALCGGCQTKSLTADLVDGRCPTCRGVETPAPATQPTREHSKDGGQVYEHFTDADLDTRYHAPASVPAEPAPEPDNELPATPVDLVALTCEHATNVLTRSAASRDPLILMLRTAALSTLAALDLHLELHAPAPAPPLTEPQSPAASTSPRASAPRALQKPRRRPALGGDIDEAAVVRAYVEDGDSAPIIARRYGCLAKRIRTILDRHGIERRDDRATRSGSKPRQHDQATIDALIRRYVDDDHTIEQLAADTGIGRRQVAILLRGAGVTLRLPVNLAAKQLDDAARDNALAMYLAGSSLAVVGQEFGVPPATVREIVTTAGHVIRVKGSSAATAQRLRDLGITAAQVKDWVMETGLVDTRPAGLIGGALIDAYQAAHPTDQQETP